MDYYSYLKQRYHDEKGKLPDHCMKEDVAMQVLKQEIHNVPHLSAYEQLKAIGNFTQWINQLLT